MATSNLFTSSFFLCFVFVFFVLDTANAQGLKVGFYAKTCPEAEIIVKKVIAQTISEAPSLAGPLLRMHFHDCFVRVRCWMSHIYFVAFCLPLQNFLFYFNTHGFVYRVVKALCFWILQQNKLKNTQFQILAFGDFKLSIKSSLH